MKLLILDSNAHVMETIPFYSTYKVEGNDISLDDGITSFRGIQNNFLVVEDDFDESADPSILNSALLDFHKKVQLERLSNECEVFIKGGFYSSATDAFYAFRDNDQQNFNQQLTMFLIDPTIESIFWKTEDKGVLSHTKEEFIQVCKDGEVHKRNAIGMFWELKEYILSLQDISVIKNITGDFKTEYEKMKMLTNPGQ